MLDIYQRNCIFFLIIIRGMYHEIFPVEDDVMKNESFKLQNSSISELPPINKYY